MQILDRTVPRPHRADERPPQLRLAHARERRAGQRVEAAAAAALVRHAAVPLPSARVEAVLVHPAETAVRTGAVGVPRPGAAVDREPPGLLAAYRLHLGLQPLQLDRAPAPQRTQYRPENLLFDHIHLLDRYIGTAG